LGFSAHFNFKFLDLSPVSTEASTHNSRFLRVSNQDQAAIGSAHLPDDWRMKFAGSEGRVTYFILPQWLQLISQGVLDFWNSDFQGQS